MIIDWIFPAVVLAVIGLVTRRLKKKASRFKKIAEKTENEAENTDYRKPD